MNLENTTIEDTYAEAFGMRDTRVIVTAHDEHWRDAAIREFTGYSSSVIACDAETGVEQLLTESQTPDGRVGAAILAFGFAKEPLGNAVSNRAGQCLMTCPTTAVYDGLGESTDRIPLGKHLRYFGDGFQKSKKIDGRRFWRVPVMDGEFFVEESLGVGKGVAGGNIILQAKCQEDALSAARRGSQAIRDMPNVITPFPGGVARSGSKVGSVYKKLKASTADAFCPTLKGRVETKLAPGVNCAYEIVIDGSDESSVAKAMAAAMRSAAGADLMAISAGNYGGKLGKYHFRLHDVLSSEE